MDITEIAALSAAFIAIISPVIGQVIYLINMKIKPINDRLNSIDNKLNEFDETMTLIVDGLLDDESKPRTK